MARRPSKKQDLGKIRTALQRETENGVSFDDAVAKVASELPAEVGRVTRKKPNA